MVTSLAPGFLQQPTPDAPPSLQEWLRDDLDRLIRLVEGLGRTDDDEGLKQGIATAAHDLKGLSTTYGFPVLARLCRQLQRLVLEPDPRGNQNELIELYALACLACVHDGATGERGEPLLSALLVGLENALLAYDLKL